MPRWLRLLAGAAAGNAAGLAGLSLARWAIPRLWAGPEPAASLPRLMGLVALSFILLVQRGPNGLVVY